MCTRVEFTTTLPGKWQHKDEKRNIVVEQEFLETLQIRLMLTCLYTSKLNSSRSKILWMFLKFFLHNLK